MPYPVMAVANEFIKRKVRNLTPLKLQKLIYFANYWHFKLSDNNTELVEEPFCRWYSGPTLPSLHHQLKHIKGKIIKPIPLMTIDYDNEDLTCDEYYLPEFADFEKYIIGQVIKRYGSYKGQQLANLTHIKDGAWRNDKNKHSQQGKGNGSAITKEDMKYAIYP